MSCRTAAPAPSSPPPTKPQLFLEVRNNSNVDAILSFGEAPDGAVSFDALLVADLPPPGPVDIAPEALSTIGYTSGTAGHLKGAMQCTPPGRAALSGAQ